MCKATQLILALTFVVSSTACDRPREDTAQPAGTSPAGERPTGTSGTENGDAQKFVNDLGAGNMSEIELGKLAQEKAASPDVKTFGEMLVRDHTKALDALKEAATQQNLQVPAMVPEKKRELRDRLSMLSGHEFDREFMDAMIEAHGQTVEKLEDRADDTPDALQQFATTVLPTVQQHLDQAKKIRAKLTT
jgi:putative membrane protein